MFTSSSPFRIDISWLNALLNVAVSIKRQIILLLTIILTININLTIFPSSALANSVVGLDPSINFLEYGKSLAEKAGKYGSVVVETAEKYGSTVAGEAGKYSSTVVETAEKYGSKLVTSTVKNGAKIAKTTAKFAPKVGNVIIQDVLPQAGLLVDLAPVVYEMYQDIKAEDSSSEVIDTK